MVRSVGKTAAPISYQGRQARREASETRRLAILEAALRLVANEGVRGIRHRAVAAEAGVPLSATTYYFKDIEDLIADAFALFVERSITGVVYRGWEKGYAVLGRHVGSDFHNEQVRSEVLAELVAVASDYVREVADSYPEELRIEYAFMHACLLDARLREVARHFGTEVLVDLKRFCDLMQAPEPEMDAMILLDVMRRLQYECMLDPVLATPDYVHHVMARTAGALFGIPVERLQAQALARGKQK